MVKTFEKPTQTYDDAFAITAKLFQHAEKYKIPVVFESSPQQNRRQERLSGKDFARFFMNMKVLDFYNDDLPIPGELEELIAIKDIILEKDTGLTVIKKSGEYYIKEDYEIISVMDKLQFNLIQRVKSISRSDFSLADGKFDKEEQVIFTTRIPTPNFFLTHAEYSIPKENWHEGYGSYSEKLIFTETHKMDAKLVDGSYGDLMITLISLSSLATLFKILKDRNGYNITEEGFKYIFYESYISRKDIFSLNDVSINTKLDLSQDTIPVFQLLTITSPENFIITKNKINAADGFTYSKYILANNEEPTAFNAFDIIPSDPTIDNLKVKTMFADVNNILFRSNIFFLEELNTETAIKKYDDTKENFWSALKEKWDKIETRIEKYNGPLFVPKLELALKFINKYFLPSVNISNYRFESYFYEQIFQNDPKARIPFSFGFFKYLLHGSVSNFFNVGEYENYFLNYYKFGQGIEYYGYSNNRIEAHGQLSFDSHAVKSFYFYRDNYNDRTKGYLSRAEWNRRKIIIVLEDSFTKQSWKKKTREFAKQLPKYSVVRIIRLPNKIEVLKAKKIFRDRPGVYFYSEFAKKIKNNSGGKKEKSVPAVRYFPIDKYHTSSDAVSSTKQWVQTTDYDKLAENKTAVVLYSPKDYTFEIKGKSYDLNRHTFSRLHFWQQQLEKYFNIELVLINKINLTRLEKKENVKRLDDYLDIQLFLPFKNSMMGGKIPVRADTLLHVKLTEVLHFVLIEIGRFSRYNSDKGKRAWEENIAYQMIKLMPKRYQNLIGELMVAILNNREVYMVGSETKYNFTEKMATMEIPSTDSFDYNILNELFRKEVITIDEQLVIELANNIREASRNAYMNDIFTIKKFHETLESALQTKYNLNFNKDEFRQLLTIHSKLYQLDITQKFLIHFYKE
jgi:hypothetical protein